MVTRLNVAVAECDLVQGNIYIKVNTHIQNKMFTVFFRRLCDIKNKVKSNLQSLPVGTISKSLVLSFIYSERTKQMEPILRAKVNHFFKSLLKVNSRGIMQLFSADAAIFLKKSFNIFCPRKHEKPPLQVAHNWPPKCFFSFANWPKTSPNHIFCFKNMSLFANSK